MIIGITGSSGAGKSTTCKILAEDYQAKIISADKIAKELAQKGSPYFQEIVQKFGTEILLENGELNRRKLANIIYKDSKKREQLNELTYEHIGNAIKQEVQNSSKKLIVIDVPLLFESSLNEICNVTIAIIAKDKETQIKRIMDRDGIDREHATARLNAQNSNEFYSNQCKYTITNDGKIIDLKKQLSNIIEKLF